MRILYLHQYFVPPTGPGGTRSYEFARRLIAAGHEVVMVTSSAMLPPAMQRDTRGRTEDIAGIPTVVVHVPYANEMAFSDRIKAFLAFALRASREATRHKADVIFATSTPLTIAIPAIAGRLAQRVPMVFEVRDLWPELPIAFGALTNPALVAAARALEWCAYHAAAHVVALSPGMKEGVVRRGIAPQRVSVIPNSCDVELFDVPASRGAPIRESLGLGPKQPLIVYAGTFGHINGVGWMVDLAAATREVAPEIRFLLLGKGAQLQTVRERAQAAGVLDETLFIRGPVPKAEMPAVLAAATVASSLFVPIEAMWHNSANKFFDALAAGRPVMINYRGWQAALIEETGCGLVLPEADPAEAARRLAAFVADEVRLARARASAARAARERFHRDRLFEALERVLVSASGRR